MLRVEKYQAPGSRGRLEAIRQLARRTANVRRGGANNRDRKPQKGGSQVVRVVRKLPGKVRDGRGTRRSR
jgi:hypothetical protein